MKHPEHHIFEMTPDSLREWCVERGMKPFRASQILEWVYGHGVAEPAQMSNLSRQDRDVLARDMTFLSGDVMTRQLATDGTRKLLVQWHDGGRPSHEAQPRTISLLPVEADPSRQTECVMIPATSEGDDGSTRARRTACISSQVGCPVGCRFCASGLGGLDGNLSAGRIVEQAWLLSWRAAMDGGGDDRDGASRITNIVFMGMGEPLANFKAVTGAVRTLHADWGMGISARKITISTVGLPQAINRLAEEMDLPITLALSLHAPTDDIRRRLIPWAEYTTIDDLLAACRAWFKKTGREITLEYTLMHGVNDQPRHAEQLARVARTLRSSVNLIRYNEVDGLEFKRPLTRDVLAFQKVLEGRGVTTRIRASRGRDIAAACGQLRHEGMPA